MYYKMFMPILHGSLWEKRKIWGDSSHTNILKAAAPIFLQFGSYVQQKWPFQEPITTELAAFKCSSRAVFKDLCIFRIYFLART